jgi:hypothetical protein
MYCNAEREKFMRKELGRTLLRRIILIGLFISFTSISLPAFTWRNHVEEISPASELNLVVPAPGDAKEIDACKLVTKAEVEQVMGEKMKDPDSGPASMAGGSICMFEAPDSMSAKHVTIRVESPRFDWNKVKEDKRIEGERMQPKRGRIRPVGGLGKEAYFARHVLHVLTDHGILTIVVFKDAADAAAGEEAETKAESAEKVLAAKAVARM